jgi:hypothetical protein
MSNNKSSKILTVAAISFVLAAIALFAVSRRKKEPEFIPDNGKDNCLSGKEVKEVVSGYGSRIGTDMALFAEREINDADQYLLTRVPIESIFASDAELKRFVMANKSNPKFADKKYKEGEPILISQPNIRALTNAGAQTRTGIVRDGYKRITLAFLNNCPDIPAFIKKQA